MLVTYGTNAKLFDLKCQTTFSAPLKMAAGSGLGTRLLKMAAGSGLGTRLSKGSLVPRPLLAAILIKARKMVWELSAYSLAESTDPRTPIRLQIGEY